MPWFAQGRGTHEERQKLGETEDDRAGMHEKLTSTKAFPCAKAGKWHMEIFWLYTGRKGALLSS